MDVRQFDDGGDLGGDGAAKWPREQWWEAYNDSQLNQLVKQAVSQSPTLRLAAARVRRAQGAAQVAGADLYPALNAGGQSFYTYYSKEAFKPAVLAGHTNWDNNALFFASYTLDLWGGKKAARFAGLSSLAATAAEAQQARLLLETSVVRTYVNLATQYSLLRIARKTLDQRETVFNLSRRLLDAGLGTDLAVNQAEISIPATRARIEDLESKIVVAKQQLAALIGEAPGAGKAITEPTVSMVDASSVPASLPAELAGRRPDIVAARWRVEAAGQNIKVAKTAFYPNINLSAATGLSSIGYSRFFTPDAMNAVVGPAVTLPIFQGGRLRGKLTESVAAYDEAVEQYNQTVVDAFAAIAGGVEQLRSLERQAAESEKALDIAKRTYELAERSYGAGLIEYLNVVNSENSLLNEEERSAVIASRRLDAYAGLMYELGGGVKSPCDDDPPVPAAMPAKWVAAGRRP